MALSILLFFVLLFFNISYSSESPKSLESPPQDWNNLTIVTNQWRKNGLIYRPLYKNKKTQEWFTFGDFRKEIDSTPPSEAKITWTHQHERWILTIEKNNIFQVVFIERTSFVNGKTLILMDRLYKNGEHLHEEQTLGLMKGILEYP